MHVLLHQIPTLLLVRLAMVVLDRLSFPLIQWKAVTPFSQHRQPMGPITSLGPAKILVAMRPTWNLTQVRPNNGCQFLM